MQERPMPLFRAQAEVFKLPQAHEATHTTKPATSPMLLDAREAARVCGVSRSHFLAMHSAGKVPLPVRLGRRTLWRGAELAAWIEADCPARDRWLTMTRLRPAHGRQEGGRP